MNFFYRRSDTLRSRLDYVCFVHWEIFGLFVFSFSLYLKFFEYKPSKKNLESVGTGLKINLCITILKLHLVPISGIFFLNLFHFLCVR